MWTKRAWPWFVLTFILALLSSLAHFVSSTFVALPSRTYPRSRAHGNSVANADQRGKSLSHPFLGCIYSLLFLFIYLFHYFIDCQSFQVHHQRPLCSRVVFFSIRSLHSINLLLSLPSSSFPLFWCSRPSSSFVLPSTPTQLASSPRPPNPLSPLAPSQLVQATGLGKGTTNFVLWRLRLRAQEHTKPKL